MTHLSLSRKRALLVSLLVSLALVAALAVMLLHHAPSHAAAPTLATPPTHGLVNLIESGTQVTFSPTSLALTHGPRNTGAVYFSNQTTTVQTVIGPGLPKMLQPGQRARVNAPIGTTIFTLQGNSSARLTVTVS